MQEMRWMQSWKRKLKLSVDTFDFEIPVDGKVTGDIK